jgi:hypothetical protein
MRRALSPAEQQGHLARLAFHRAQRAQAASTLAMSSMIGRGMFWYFVVVVALIPFVTVVVCIVRLARIVGGDASDPADLPLFVVGAVGLAGLILGVGFLARRSDRRRRMDDALGDLTRQFARRVFQRSDDLAAWLYSLWAGPFDLNHLYVGAGHRAVALEVHGYQALVDLELDWKRLGKGPSYPPRLLVLVAAVVPGAEGQGILPLPSHPAVAQRGRWIWDAGFEVHVQSGGLFAQARADALARYRERPETLVELAPVLGTLAALADALGAAPVSVAA